MRFMCLSMVRLRSVSSGSEDTAAMSPRALDPAPLLLRSSLGSSCAPVCLFKSSTACEQLCSLTHPCEQAGTSHLTLAPRLPPCNNTAAQGYEDLARLPLPVQLGIARAILLIGFKRQWH